ncbi:MAG: VOC family protein [Lachnospiraceae bacterium]
MGNKRVLDHINITVPNLAKSVDFYTTVLGFEVTHRFMNGAREFVFLKDGLNTYEVFENADLSAAVIDHLAYVSEDIEADYKHFMEVDSSMVVGEVGFVEALFENGMYYFFIKGPAGEKIEFCQRK